MQKLLTKGIGHDEFKEVRIGPKTYEIPEEWEILSLKKVSKIKGGGTPQRSVKEYWEGKIPWLTLSNISTKNKNFISKTDEYITEKALNESSAKLLPSGTIMISSRATIGEGVINRVPMTTNQGFVNIICDKSKFYNLYGLYLLRSFKNYLISLAGGSTFLEISKKSFRNIDVFIPKIKEQKLIANILLNIDNKIKKEKKYKEKLERLKKGLMQKLLTGKIRVKTANSE
jgi:type I restriction enzyme S subunit